MVLRLFMDYIRIKHPEGTAEANVSIFSQPEGVSEYHAMIRVTNNDCPAVEQYAWLEEMALHVRKRWPEALPVWKRYFIRDVAHAFSTNDGDTTAVSMVQQPPVDGTDVALWLYLASDVRMQAGSQTTIMTHGAYRHYFHTQLYSLAAGEATQTEEIFRRYVRLLAQQNCTLAQHTVRTWIYVKDIDTQYAGMAAARKAFFEQEGLTSETHYIASTGIEGQYLRSEALVFMDAYAVQGLQPDQIRYLHAPDYLNPTHEYGVTFERGTSIDYGDRRHVYISGTASINNRGEVEHPGDLLKQTERTFRNIQALLAEGDTSMDDVACLIVYLRNPSDGQTVNSCLQKMYPHIPRVVVHAPVCRPDWLVEVECVAIKPQKNCLYDAF
ncbi:MAG: hypothetical protein LBD27_07815 [Tannerella sp.]|nr:hypothetical protein [Tannerella sp.]